MTEQHPTYHDRIVTDPTILVGKPTLKGTRIAVEHVLQQLEDNPDTAELFAAYPDLTLTDVQACLTYAPRWSRAKTSCRHPSLGPTAARPPRGQYEVRARPELRPARRPRPA